MAIVGDFHADHIFAFARPPKAHLTMVGVRRKPLLMRIFSLLLVILLLPSLRAADKKVIVTVEAGDFDRHDTVVSFAFSQSTGKSLALQREGKLSPLQAGKDGRACFRLDALKKGARASYEVVPDPATTPPGIGMTRDKTKLKFTQSGQPRLEYQAEPGALPRDDIKTIFTRGGYLHPILTPAGRMVTDDFPPNHIHHHGVWWAWTHTEFEGRKPDFWNMGDGKGRVDFVALAGQWDGPVHGGFQARHRFEDLTAGKPITVLVEHWEVTVFAASSREKAWWIFDLTSEQTCAANHPLKLPQYHYGGLGLRGNRAWNGKENCHFLTSEGETDRVQGHATRARWCDMWGEVDGAKAGIAILGHPDNFRAPQPMRLHPDEPFFCYAPQQTGDMEIKPGELYVSRYRFVVHDGPPNQAELDRLWNDFAKPPTVSVEEK